MPIDQCIVMSEISLRQQKVSSELMSLFLDHVIISGTQSFEINLRMQHQVT